MGRELLILGCSQAKRQYGTPLPALEVYDGPYYRVLRKFLREYQWPSNVAVSALSAEHGLFGVIKDIGHYNRRMDPETAAQMIPQCLQVLRKWEGDYANVHLALGQDYRAAIQTALDKTSMDVSYLAGSIALKQKQVKDFLYRQSPCPRTPRKMPPRQSKRLTYFLPDWDDLLDPNFDFANDCFSRSTRAERGDRHCHQLMKPFRMCDGILVSLAQRQTSKGPLRRLDGTERQSLIPEDLHAFFGLDKNQYLFGDCGAFSYVGEPEPTISTEQALALYELYHFDLGASVDHIPVKTLPESERQRRVQITVNNAEDFIQKWRRRGRLFTPVGTVQGTNPQQYADYVSQYYDMGYRHLAIGGLVPMQDAAIEAIVKAISEAADRLSERPWLHLYGIYRPKLQLKFRKFCINSFDSATYFRKAWLRSDQNYLSVDGTWHTAIRVPMTRDPRTRKRLEQSDVDIIEAERQEQEALRLLEKYGQGYAGIDETLDAVLEYDQQLQRASDIRSMRERYRRTLESKPWQDCDCPFCQKLGIHMLIFRGGNRNRRRGAHNTVRLYQDTRKTK